MLEILQIDTKQGTVTPTEIADNILNIMGKIDSLLIACKCRKGTECFHLLEQHCWPAALSSNFHQILFSDIFIF